MTATAARDLHVGDVYREHDWPLHVIAVVIEADCVAFVVSEFPGMLHHRAGGDMLDVTLAVL